MMRNCVILTANFSPEYTGIAVHTTDLANVLNSKGYHVAVFSALPYYPDWNVRLKYRGKLFIKENKNGFNVYRNWLYVPNNNKKISLLQRMIHEYTFFIFQLFNILFHIKIIHKADLIIIFSPPFLQGLNALLLSIVLRKKIVFHVEDIQPDSAVDLEMIDRHGFKLIMIHILQFLERAIYKTSYKVSTLTSGMRQNIMGKIGSSNGNVILLPYWVDFKKYKKDESARKRFREKLSLPYDYLLIGYAGNIGKKQKLDYLLEIASSEQINKRVYFLIAGNGAERSKIESLIEKKN